MINWFNASEIKNDEELDIRFHLEKGLIKKSSLIVNVITLAVYCLQFVSPMIWYAKYVRRKKTETHNEWFPMWLTEVWIFFKFFSLIALILILGLVSITRTCIWWYLLLFPVWFLLDNLTALGRDLILAPNLHKNNIYVYDFQRWMILTLLGAFEVILSFSVLILFYSDCFTNLEPHIILNSIYYSAVTFCTLGYGDIHPLTDKIAGQIVILLELFYFFIFIIVKIPIAVSMFNVQIIERPNKK